MKNIRMAAVTAAAVLMLTACGSGTESSKAEGTPKESVSSQGAEDMRARTVKNDDGSMYAELSEGMPEFFEASDGWTNGDPFNVCWRGENVRFEDGIMRLVIDEDVNAEGLPYSGGEFRSRDFYGYGRFEVSMRAIKNDGVVSSFFTYTGPSDGNPWDEIDVEILGKDTTKVQFNYYTSGQGGHEYMYDLGFDSAEDFHTYAFEWHRDKIVWFVDGQEAYSVTENLPVTDAKIMMNAWCGKGVDGWLNAFNGAVPLSAEYEWVRFTPFDE